MIRIACPTCGKLLKVADELAGKTGKCPACGKPIKVPAPQAVAPQKPVAPAPQPRPQVLLSEPVPHAPPVAPTVVAVQVQQPSKASHSLGIASLVLGIIAFLICWIPFLGLLGLPLSVLGVVLGGVGLLLAFVRKGSGIGFSIAGTALSLLSAFVVIGITTATVKSLEEASAKAQATQQTVLVPSTPTEPAADTPDSRPSVDREQPPKATAPEQQWADARNAVQQGDLQVRIAKVSVGKVPLKDAFREGSKSKDDFLMVNLELVNKNPTKKVEYHSWSGKDISFDRDYATLEDNFGNSYKRISFGFGSNPIGAVEGSESIYPNKSVTDVLVFETPLETIEYLRLELPAKNFGGTGMLRLQIPKDMIVP